MTSNPDESPNSPRNPSPAGSSSASSHNWLLVIARILIVLACVPFAMPMYELLQMNENPDFAALDMRRFFYLGTGLCLAVLSAVLSGLRKYKVERELQRKTMISNPDESPNSPVKPLPARTSSASSGDWLLVPATIFALLSVVALAMMLWHAVHWNEVTDFDFARFYFYGWTSAYLGMISGALFGVRQFKLQPDRALVASRLLDVPQFGALSLNDLQKMGGKKLFAWLWDGVLMIAVVFSFALGACMNSNTHPIIAAVCLTFAVLYPSMAESTRRQREAIFGVPSRDELENKHGD